MKKSYGLICLAAILWGSLCIFVDLLTKEGLLPIEIVAICVLFSALILIGFVSIKNRSWFKVKVKDVPLFIAIGIICIVFVNYGYYSTITESGPSVASFLLNTAPIVVMLLSLPVLHERITNKKIISLVIVIIGLLFITGVLSSGEKISVKSAILGIGSGIGYGLYSILTKFIVKKYNTVTILTYTFIVATISIVPLINLDEMMVKLVNVDVIVIGIGMAVFGNILPYVLFTLGLNQVESGKASILATLEPLVATVLGVLLYNESITISKLIVMILIIIAIVVLNLNIRRYNTINNL